MASQFGGAMPPPQGIEPNFIDPPSLQDDNLIQHATSLSLVTIFVAMRIYTRLHVLKSGLGADDYFCMVSYALDWAYSMLMIESCSRGLGRHMWDVPALWIPGALKYLSFAAYAYILLTGSIKLTFLFCYRRIFSTKSLTLTLINLGIAFVSCLTLGLFFASIFLCSPVERAWNVAVPGTCSNPRITTWISTISSTITDLYIFILPIAPLWQLNMGLRKKLKITVAFGFGLMACIASLIRLGMTRILQGSVDATWNTASIGRWSAIEVDVGLICSCLMLLPAFLKHHLPESLKALLSRSLDRLSNMSSRRTQSRSLPQHGFEKAWPTDKYRNIEERELDMSILRTQDAMLETVHSREDRADDEGPWKVNVEAPKSVWERQQR